MMVAMHRSSALSGGVGPEVGVHMWLGRDGVSWVICGGETGPGARPSAPEWFRALRDQCGAAPVPFFFKQWGAGPGRMLDGRAWDDMPGSS